MVLKLKESYYDISTSLGWWWKPRPRISGQWSLLTRHHDEERSRHDDQKEKLEMPSVDYVRLGG